MGGVLSRIIGLFRRKDPRTPVKGIVPRIKNIGRNNYRGLIGFFVPLAALSWNGQKNQHWKTVACMWIWMAWSFLFQPVNIPVTALIPIFVLPMAGVMSTVETCQCYMSEGIVLFLLTSMLLLLLNNTGFDRRVALWLLCSGDACQYSGKRLVFKCTTAAFFLSMFCSRLIVTSVITQYVAPTLINLQSATSRYRATEPDYDEMRHVVCNAIQTASSIVGAGLAGSKQPSQSRLRHKAALDHVYGSMFHLFLTHLRMLQINTHKITIGLHLGSIAMPHSALGVLAMRTIFHTCVPKGNVFPDIFNFFQYTVYAFPVAFLMHVLNFAYNMLLINYYVKKPMSASSMAQVRSALMKHKDALPKEVTAHEKLSVFFTIAYLIAAFSRYNNFFKWAEMEATSNSIPRVLDSTVAAMFVLILHLLPNGCGFLKYTYATKKSELPPIKPQSAILWWRFVDKNMNYGYIFLFGCGVAIAVSVRESGLNVELANGIGTNIAEQTWNLSIFLVCLVAVVLANSMSGVAACAVWLPFVLNMPKQTNTDWTPKLYLGALAVGLGSSFGFMWPFLYTPAFFCHYSGKVPKQKMAKYGAGSAIICLIILWVSLLLWAPFLWDPNNAGIHVTIAPVEAGVTTNATTSAGAAAAAAAPEPGGL